MSDFGLPEPVRVDRGRQGASAMSREGCQQFVDAHLSLLSPDERVILDEVMDDVHNDRSLLIRTEESGLKECMESSSFQEIQVEAAKKLSRWYENMQHAEEVVYHSFLVSAAREVGVDANDQRGYE